MSARVALRYRRKRKRREGEDICHCSAYGFPHRLLGGRCNAGIFIQEFFDTNQCGACRGCNAFDAQDWVCEVLVGKETVLSCEGLADHIRYLDIKLPPRLRGKRR